MKPTNTIEEILGALASPQQGDGSLIVRIEPDLIQHALSALRGYKKVFAAVIPGLTDTAPIYAAYERIRQADETRHTLLLLVECQTTREFSDAIGRLPVNESSEWRTG